MRESVDDLAATLGEQLRALRLRRNLTQAGLADRANVSLNVIRHLEAGQGATVEGLLRVLKSLERTDWLKSLAPQVGISPLQVLESERRAPRQRASQGRARRAL